MKILHTITGLHAGGAENMLAKLIESNVSRERYQSAVLSLMKPGMIADRIRARDVAVHTLGMRQGVPSLPALVKLGRVGRAVRPDIILGWMHHGNLAATMASRMLRSRPPVIWNIRHSLVNLANEKPLTRFVLRASRRLSKTPAAIIYNSRAAARQFEAFGFPTDRAIFIPNGFDCGEFRPRMGARAELCQMFGISENATIVGMVARCHPMKDPENLVEAVRRARQAGHDLHLLIIGHGVDKPGTPLAKAISVAFPPDRVTTTGFQHNIAKWLAGLDIFALPSAWGEGFPNVIGEAMACGVPCVATDVGDSGWIIDDTGRTVPPNDPEALAQALAWLDSLGADGRRRLGEKARERVMKEFSLSRIRHEYEVLFDRVYERAAREPDCDDDSPDAKISACAG